MEPDSPLRSMPGDLRAALHEFRHNWERELHGQSESVMSPTDEVEHQEQEQTGAEEAIDQLAPLPNMQDTAVDAEQQALAEKLFGEAVALEQRGKVYDALPLYRKALQIMPDIEFKFHERQSLKGGTGGTNAESNKPFSSHVDTPFDDSENGELWENLYDKFRMDLARDFGGKLLLNSRDAGVISTELHISDLPTEILLYILRWVVSTQLDMHSLEQCAAVCKGLYLCARDEDLWRLVCMKVWGYNVGTLLPPDTPTTSALALGCLPYYSWRQMYIERERLLFSGCYISKTTYLRMGENSFQDQFYRPVQLVEYYRYVRFLPDGTVYMMTNADEPLQGVAKLRNLHQLRAEVMRGHYRLFGNTVSVMLKTPMHQQRIITTGARQRRGSIAHGEDVSSTNYCIEFCIMSTPRRKFSQLTWQHYSIEQTRNKVKTTTEFDLTPARYPPLWFSPVRSYHLDADTPLT